MDVKQQTVIVNANFGQGDDLFAWIKKYSQYADDGFVYWDGIRFTIAHLPQTDALLVLNQPSGTIHTLCDPGKILAFMMEPGDPSENYWMFKKLERYAKVYSPIQASANTVLSHGYMGWSFEQDRQFFLNAMPPEKTKAISCISSHLVQLPGHRKRFAFVNALREQMPHIDFFGKGTNFIPDKLEALLAYRYSIAIENTSAPFYFTEKINDCFLAYTVPVYYGCKNIGNFFPEKSFISIDINDYKKAFSQIEKCLFENDWEERAGALQEARLLVLNKYQPLAGAAGILRGIKPSARKKEITLAPVPPPLRKYLANWWMEFKKRQPVASLFISQTIPTQP